MLGMLAIISCKKEAAKPAAQEPTFFDPAMTYLDLSGKSVAMNQGLAIDLDNNNKTDLLFYTELLN